MEGTVLDRSIVAKKSQGPERALRALALLISSMGAYQYSSFLLSQTNKIINQAFFVTERSNFAQTTITLFLSPFGGVSSRLYYFSSTHYFSKRKDRDLFHTRFCRFIMSCSIVGSMAMAMALEKSRGNAQHENRRGLDFAETELKLGLPGVAADESREHQKNYGKRSFSEAMESRSYTSTDEDITRTGTPEDADKFHRPIVKEIQMTLPANDPATAGSRPPPKAQIVGWPPVKDFRKVRTISACDSLYVKVSMDGAPYLRKVNLKMYSTYHDLSSALENMFSCLVTMQGKSRCHGLNESNLLDMPNGLQYVPTYEDKDGDWMLVGDVPWEMFVDSCQRMRIMKASEAIGLAPRIMEKCKKRN